jgi:anti-sigma regulatory factor (Ser/Thr protein kinase)
MKRSDIVLQGKYSEYDALRGFIALFAQREGYSDLFVEELQLTMKEAFVNAIKHGNRERDDLSVSVSLIAFSETLLASVRDCGKGFNPDKLPNPIDPRNLFRLSGRGVYIIRSIAEIIAIEHDGEGSVLTLRYCPY